MMDMIRVFWEEAFEISKNNWDIPGQEPGNSLKLLSNLVNFSFQLILKVGKD